MIQQTEVKYLCKTRGNKVGKPGFFNRSWCPNCEAYEAPERVEVDADPEGDVSPAGSDHAYTYTTWRPRANSFQRGETAEHRFMYVKRTDHMIPHGRGVSYKAKCTCKTWNNPNGFTTRQAAYRQWQGHMAEVDKQGTLPVD